MVDKRLKYVLYILMIISLVFSIKNKVNAATFTLRQPNRVNARNHSNNNQTNIGSKSSVWWDIAFWEANAYIGHNSASLTYDLFSYQWDNYGLCDGKQMLIEGKIGALPVAGGAAGFFVNSGGKFDIYNNGSRMNCFYSFDNNDRISYSCSGIGGGSLIININWDNPTSYYNIGVSKNVNISCDVTQADIQNSINNLNNSINNQTTNIINNQNNNTQSIINNQNQNAQNTQQKIDNIDNTIKDSSIDNQNAQNTFDNLNSNMASNNTISQLLLMPISLLQKILNAMSGSCTAINTGQILGTDFILPCINISDIIGSTLWNVIDVICSGFMAFAIGKRFIKIFNQFTNLKEGGLESAYD